MSTLRNLFLALVVALSGCTLERVDHDLLSEDAGRDATVRDAGREPQDEDAAIVDAGSGSIDASAGTDAGSAESDLFDCETRDTSGASVVGGEIDTDTNWSGTVHVTSVVNVVEGVKLTIEAGTYLLMASATGLVVGGDGSAASIVADGTPEAPIRICGESADAGGWDAVRVERNATPDSILRHVLISDGAGSDAALVLDAAIVVADVHVRNSGSDAVHASNFEDDSERLFVEGASGAAVVLTAPRAVTNFPLGGSLSGNGEDVVRLRFNDIGVNTIYSDPGIPYVQEGWLRVLDGATVTFDAGVELRFAASTGIEAGWDGAEAILRIEGTETEPVVFRGESEASGFWNGLLVRGNVSPTSSIEWLELRHAGGGDAPALGVEAPIAVRNTMLHTNQAGVWLAADGFAPGSANLTITATAGVPMTVQPNALITLPEGGSYEGNTEDYVDVEGGDYSEEGTVPSLGVPYRVRGSIDTVDGSSLTLSPGTVFVMMADTQLEIGWNNTDAKITAVGTASNPIRFVGSDPTPGNWGGLQIRRNVRTDSTLEYVEIGHGGAAGDGYNLLLDRRITVTNSTFFDSSGYGILKDAAIPTDYTTGNSFMNNASGDVGTF